MEAGAIYLLFPAVSLRSSGCSVNVCLLSIPASLKSILHLADRHDACFQGSSLMHFYINGESSKIFISINLDGYREKEVTFIPNAFLPQIGY